MAAGLLGEEPAETVVDIYFIEVKNCSGGGNYSELFSELLRK